MNDGGERQAGSASETLKLRNGFVYCHPLQVRFRDCDPMGHVNNAVYFTYLEQARFAYWREVVRIPHDAKRSFIIARGECDYESAAVAGEWLDVWIRTASIGRSSFVLEYDIVTSRDHRLVARARTVQVMYDYTSARPLPVPDDLAVTLERYEGRGLRTRASSQ